MNNIFVFWWQGIDNAPDIIKICHKSLLRNYDKKTQKIHIIDKNNYNKYVNMPKYIIEKLDEGIISIIHFSDLLRAMLLYKYGGLWMDASIFVTSRIDQEIFKKDFFIKRNPKSEDKDITLKWQIFLMGAKPEYKLFKFLIDFWLEYWKRENKLIDYLLTDHIFYIAYKENEEIRNNFEKAINFYYPLDYFQKIINQKYEEETFKEICSNEKFIKLTYKSKLVEEKDGELTYYGYLLKEYELK